MKLWEPLAAPFPLIITGRDQCIFQPLCNSSIFQFSYERAWNATAHHGKGHVGKNCYSVFSLESAMCLVKHSGRPWSCLCLEGLFLTEIPALFSKISTKTSSHSDNSVYNYSTIISRRYHPRYLYINWNYFYLSSTKYIVSGFTLRARIEKYISFCYKCGWFYKHHACLLGTRSLKHFSPFWNPEVLEGKEFASLVGCLFKSSSQIQPGDTA